MRLLFYHLLLLLSFMGLSLNAAMTCECPKAEHTTAGIEAVPCCQDAPADCCVQQNRDTAPEQSLLAVMPSVDDFPLQLTLVSTLTDVRALFPPQATFVELRARPPPRPSNQHRCTLQSWLI
jgi:hypothetical protein